MYTRHLEVPLYSQWQSDIQAIYYNHVVTALKRSGGAIRLNIPRLRTLDLILQPDAWIVVDAALNDIPIVCWTEFQTHDRQSLHQPIPCRILMFHAHGDIIMDRVLEAMELMLGEQFDPDPEQMSKSVTELKPRSK